MLYEKDVSIKILPKRLFYISRRLFADFSNLFFFERLKKNCFRFIGFIFGEIQAPCTYNMRRKNSFYADVENKTKIFYEISENSLACG